MLWSWRGPRAFHQLRRSLFSAFRLLVGQLPGCWLAEERSSVQMGELIALCVSLFPPRQEQSGHPPITIILRQSSTRADCRKRRQEGLQLAPAHRPPRRKARFRRSQLSLADGDSSQLAAATASHRKPPSLSRYSTCATGLSRTAAPPPGSASRTSAARTFPRAAQSLRSRLMLRCLPAIDRGENGEVHVGTDR